MSSSLSEVIDAFNEKPREGIEVALAAHLKHKPTAQEVADFLFDNRTSLDKRQIGEYLGEGKDFNIVVLGLHAAKAVSGEKDFLRSLRGYLDSFQMPGEGQKVDRMMEAFGKSYSQKKPDISQDGAYILAVSTMMVGTNLNNPAVKTKMTRDQFISSNRGLNQGKNFNAKMLTAIYESIKQYPIIPDQNLEKGLKKGVEEGLYVVAHLLGKEGQSERGKLEKLNKFAERFRSHEYTEKDIRDMAKELAPYTKQFYQVKYQERLEEIGGVAQGINDFLIKERPSNHSSIGSFVDLGRNSDLSSSVTSRESGRVSDGSASPIYDVQSTVSQPGSRRNSGVFEQAQQVVADTMAIPSGKVKRKDKEAWKEKQASKANRAAAAKAKAANLS